jgi:hypothetical protein
MRRPRFLALLALVSGAACLDPTAPPRQGVRREGGSTARELAFTVQPSAFVAGGFMTRDVEVAAQDALGIRDTTFTGTVTLAIGTNPSGGTLTGTLSAAAVAGVASFPILTIDRPGTGYTLAAAASGLTSATSSPFDVIAPSGLSARR